MDQLRFDDQAFVITGAGHGLGRSYARLLAARGARIVVNDLGGSIDGGPAADGDTPAQNVVDEIASAGGRAVASVHDIADEDAARACVQLALDSFGRIDGVINNAGINPSAPFGETPRPMIEKVFAVHVLGAFAVLQAAWPHFVAQGYGRVINTCSGAMYQGHGVRATYSAAKGALYGLTRDLAVEGGDHGIMVNALCPGARSRMMVNSSPDTIARMSAWSPDAVANVVAVLMHRDCPVNGEVIESRGGEVRRLFMAAAPGATFDTDAMTPELVAADMDTVLDPASSVRIGALVDIRGRS